MKSVNEGLLIDFHGDLQFVVPEPRKSSISCFCLSEAAAVGSSYCCYVMILTISLAAYPSFKMTNTMDVICCRHPFQQKASPLYGFEEQQPLTFFCRYRIQQTSFQTGSPSHVKYWNNYYSCFLMTITCKISLFQ
ncbi:hypothetical protein JOB18_000681 [Solea senegalensis]|uniref:Uncharacterized protein n=1 Tax=Solea senegalensis TaxID=28829 RepID=A0AAV6RAF9_SOLSE|nr:hypothetical protein JOB18_000681 [Solea senegalensis]